MAIASSKTKLDVENNPVVCHEDFGPMVITDQSDVTHFGKPENPDSAMSMGRDGH